MPFAGEAGIPVQGKAHAAVVRRPTRSLRQARSLVPSLPIAWETPPEKPAPVPRSVRKSAAGTRAGDRRASLGIEAVALTQQLQQMLDQLSELTEIKALVQVLSAKLDAVLEQQGASGEHDPGDAVPPGVAVQAAAPLSAEDQAVLEKLEEEPEAADPESQQSD